MDALYFPHLSLPPSTWVNPALLFFDQLAVIAPEGLVTDHHDRRTRQLIERGMVRPETPHGGWGGEPDRMLMEYLLSRTSKTPRDVRISRIHAGKLAYGPLASDLLVNGLLMSSDGGWLEGPDWVVSHLMSYLALQISTHSVRPLLLITDERAAARVMVGRSETVAARRRLRAATRLLPVPPEAMVSDIAAFRDRHRRELKQFRTYVTELISCDPADPLGEERFEKRLEEALAVRQHLVGEMHALDWRERGTTISLLALSTVAAPLDHAPWTFGAGLIGLGLTGVQTAFGASRRRQAEASRMVYAAKVVGRWPPAAAATLW